MGYSVALAHAETGGGHYAAPGNLPNGYDGGMQFPSGNVRTGNPSSSGPGPVHA